MKLNCKVAISIFLIISPTIGTPKESGSKTNALERVFDVDFESQKNGGLQGHKGDMEKIYYEALDVIQDTVKALDFLLGLKAEPTSATKDAYKEYLRISQPFKLLLGNEDVWTQKGISPRVKEARDHYSSFLSAHEIEKTAKTPHFYLRGGDHWVQYLAPENKDPREKGKPDANKFTLAHPRHGLQNFPYGAFYLPGLQEQHSLSWAQGKPDNPSAPFCDNRQTKAVSIPKCKLLLFCSRYYMRPPYSIGGRNPHDFPDQKKSGDEGGIDEGESLDITGKVPAVTWIHEMGHYVAGWPEPEVPDPSNPGVKVPATDMERAVILSKEYSKGPIVWPENMALFAAAMHLDHWFWGSGKAKKSPEAVGGRAAQAGGSTGPWSDDRGAADS